MLFFKVLLLFCFYLQVGSTFLENCVNSSDVLWDSLNFWNGATLFRKMRIKSIENLSQKCGREVKEMIEEAFSNNLWAIKMLDASGHYEGSIFDGNEFWLGSNTQCQNLQQLRHKITSNTSSKNEDQFYRRTSENRIINNNEMDFASVPPFSVRFAVTNLILKLNSFCKLSNETERVVFVGLCLPSSCSAPDVRTTLEWAVDGEVFEVKNVNFVPGEYSVWDDKRFYFLCSLFFVAALLMTLGTALDYTTSKSDRKFHTTSWYRVLHAFSVISNLRSITSLEVGADTLAPIHGLKFISMMWVVLVHTCLILFQVAGNKKFRDKAEGDLLYQTISNGTYSVDTFFTLSGVLVSFLFFRTVAKYPVKQLIGKDGIFGHFLLYISMLVYRLLRLSFPYLVVIVLTGFLTEQKINSTPLPLPNRDHINCVHFWWRNALYVNTFYPVGEMCMMWSWYLSNDTQFYLLSVPLLLLALRFRISSLILGVILLVISWITTAIISYQTHHIIDVRDPLAHYDELYDKPWTRLGPYFIGLATGWYLFNINCTLKVPKRLNIFLWGLTLSSMIFIIYGPMYFPSNPIFGMIYTSMSRTIWSVDISWILISCVTDNGFWVNNILSWKYMYPFSRLSYCAYLVHPLLIRMIMLSSDSSYFISIEIMTVLFSGCLCLSLILAALLSLAFESPVVALLRLGHPMRNSK